MEALYFLKFWRPTTTTAAAAAATDKENRPSSGSCDDTTEIPFADYEFEEGEDSFFRIGTYSPRFRVLMFKKPKSMASQKTEKTGEAEQFNANSKRHESNKLFTVKFKLEERFSKEMIQKYLKLIKPLYIRVSKKQNDKMKFSGELSAGSPSSSPATVPAKEKQGNFPAGIRVVSRHLGKSKSASSATTGISPPIGSRRDDSLLLQHDGIQSAILHCKKSFNSSRDSSSMSSDTLHEKSMASPRISSSEENATN
ncbi:MEMBRANE-ASSOCIATED KINASE REGULATOR 2-RELATED [Salix viminalis]|uniref:MEMBRANE-ASSOCIATED KINASE REGULATOR 2-RELATED n=1 Tax=Salix viminalis TaxID=40686 RepID=A0A9Q0SH39_SALVM|nr:MEMBRANE-ASSOCIATED KINASE REGULATOR 2-RELATED [Salix viminalis]